MWMWPLDGAMGATAAHRTPERAADGTCTQVWAWMTNKCRRKMNGGEGYITTGISQSRGDGKTKRDGKDVGNEASGRRKELGIHILGWGVLSPWDVGPFDTVFLALIRSSRLLLYQPSPHQSPTFGPTLYKFIIKGPLGLDSVRHWARPEERDLTIGAVCGEGCSCDNECNDLVK